MREEFDPMRDLHESLEDYRKRTGEPVKLPPDPVLGAETAETNAGDSSSDAPATPPITLSFSVGTVKLSTIAGHGTMPVYADPERIILATNAVENAPLLRLAGFMIGDSEAVHGIGPDGASITISLVALGGGWFVVLERDDDPNGTDPATVRSWVIPFGKLAHLLMHVSAGTHCPNGGAQLAGDHTDDGLAFGVRTAVNGRTVQQLVQRATDRLDAGLEQLEQAERLEQLEQARAELAAALVMMDRHLGKPE